VTAVRRAPRAPARLDYVVRRARKADLPELIRVGIGSFRGSTNEDRWRSYYTKNAHLRWERIWVAEKDGRLLGKTSLLDFRIRIDGRFVPVDGVAAVAVDLTARRQGVADALVRRALSDARERQVPASFLYAFRPSFYRRFGYAPVEMGHVLVVRPRDLPDSPERVHVRRYRDQDFPALDRCYRAATEGATGPIERSDMWWRVRTLRDGQDRVVFDAGRGKIEGYALGMLAEQAPLGRRVLRVQELMAHTTRARRGLIAWLGALADEFAGIEVSLPSDGSWLPFLRDPHFPAVRSYFQQEPAGFVGWGCMGRLTHLERALALRAPRRVRGSLVVHAIDPVLPENDGAWTVRFGGNSSGPRVRAGSHAPLGLRGEMDVWTQVWSGALSAQAAWRFGFLEGDEEAARLLEAAWHGPAPFWGTLNEF
jgi:predicted N-acetyltransferase YhbS